MHQNPFHSRFSDTAFEVFYSDLAIVALKTGEKQTLKCCISDFTTDDPIAEDVIDSDRDTISLTFGEKDWHHVRNAKRGDKVEIGGKTYTIQNVKEDRIFGYVVTARN